MPKRPINTPDGLEDSHKGRSNRATGNDDYSVLGRGHGFGPKNSGRGRDQPVPKQNAEHREPPDRNFGRVAADRGDARPMEDEAHPRGSVARAGYGSRSRSMETP